MKLIFYAFALLGFQWCFAQSNTVVSGGNATGSGGLVNYTLGQIDYQSVNGTTGSASAGVQHAFEMTTLGTDHFPSITLSMMVYPNPTTSKIYLKVGEYNSEDLRYEVYDLQGRKLQSNKVAGVATEISLEQLPMATYLLMVIDPNQILKTFKIIKNN